VGKPIFKDTNKRMSMLEHLLVGTSQAQAPGSSSFTGSDKVSQPINSSGLGG
jgi:hypothetical protein